MKDRAEPHSPGTRARALLTQRTERLLNDGGQLRIGPDEVRKLVDHHGHGALGAEGEEPVDSFGPMCEVVGRGGPDMSGERRADPAQRLGVSGLGRTEIETSLGTTGRVEQEGLALAASAGDHSERGTGLRVGDEAGQRAAVLSGLHCRTSRDQQGGLGAIFGRWHAWAGVEHGQGAASLPLLVLQPHMWVVASAFVVGAAGSGLATSAEA
jgi:hypothetical protein